MEIFRDPRHGSMSGGYRGTGAENPSPHRRRKLQPRRPHDPHQRRERRVSFRAGRLVKRFAAEAGLAGNLSNPARAGDQAQRGGDDRRVAARESVCQQARLILRRIDRVRRVEGAGFEAHVVYAFHFFLVAEFMPSVRTPLGRDRPDRYRASRAIARARTLVANSTAELRRISKI